jgi:hypothetical protein
VSPRLAKQRNKTGHIVHILPFLGHLIGEDNGEAVGLGKFIEVLREGHKHTSSLPHGRRIKFVSKMEANGINHDELNFIFPKQTANAIKLLLPT